MWDEHERENKNPINKVKIAQPSNEPLPGVSLESVKKLLDFCSNQRDKTIILFLVDTRVRRSELCDIDVQEVNFFNGAAQIRHGKWDKSRTVYVGRKCRRELKRYLRKRNKLEPDSPLFATLKNETRLSPQGLREVIRRRANDAGIDEPGLHDFRRLFAVSCLRNGMNLVTLSRLMGHTTLEVTRRYLHLLDEDLRSAHREASPVDNAL